MRNVWIRTATIVSAIGFATASMASTGTAGAAPPLQQRTSISMSGSSCTVTATFKWKNVDAATFSVAGVNVYLWGGSQIGQATSSDPSGGSISVTVPGASGQQYYAVGTVYYDGGGYEPVTESRLVELRCR